MTREFFLKESMIMLSVVIPTFNESKNIRNLVAQIDVALKGVDYEIVFVDDSKDNTPDVIMEVAKEYPQVRMEHRKNGTGLATAVPDTNFLYQLSPPSSPPGISRLGIQKSAPLSIALYIYLRTIGGCCKSASIHAIYSPFASLKPSRTARKIGQVMLPCLRKISDPTSGLFMFRREVIENADLQPIGWKIMVEVLAMGTYSKVVEIPYKFQQRTEGESKLSGKVTLEYLKQLKNLRKRYNKSNRYEVEIWSTERMMKGDK